MFPSLNNIVIESTSIIPMGTGGGGFYGRELGLSAYVASESNS